MAPKLVVKTLAGVVLFAVFEYLMAWHDLPAGPVWVHLGRRTCQIESGT